MFRIPFIGRPENRIERLAKRLSESISTITPEIKQRLLEQYQIGIGGYGSDAGEPSDHWTYKDISWQKVDRRLSSNEQNELIKRSALLYRTNPLAKNAVDIMVNFIWGQGFRPVSDNPDLQDILDEHWYDPQNAWDTLGKDRLRDLIIFGEQVYPVFVNTANGHSVIANIDPYLVTKILTDPENYTALIKIICGDESNPDRREWNIIRYDSDGKLSDLDPRYSGKETAGHLVGQAFYFSLNRLMASSRGHSPLLSVIDWLMARDRFLFNRVENRAVLDLYIWDLLCKGATPTQIKNIVANFRKALSSSQVFAHDDMVELTNKAASLNASDAREEDKMILSMVCAGIGIPEHWLVGQGENSNRASALEMGDPTLAQLVGLQGYWKACIKTILQFHVDQVLIFSDTRLRDLQIKQGDTPETIKEKKEQLQFDLEVPPIHVDDKNKNAQTLNLITQSLTGAEYAGYITKQEAARIWAEQASVLGTEVEKNPALDTEGGRAGQDNKDVITITETISKY